MQRGWSAAATGQEGLLMFDKKTPRQAETSSTERGSGSGTSNPSRGQSLQRGGEQNLGARGGYGHGYGALSPFGMVRRMMEDMDRVFGDFGAGVGRGMRRVDDFSFGGPSPEIWSPQIEIFSRGEKLVVRADLPGLGPDDVKLHLEGDTLVLEGERKSEREEGGQDEGWYHSERSYGSFLRRIALPRGVDVNSCDASFEGGVLEVTMKLPAEGKKSVAIRGGGEAPRMSQTQPAAQAMPSTQANQTSPQQSPTPANGPASHN